MVTAPALEGPRIPPMPEIGLDEHVYAHQARIADELGDRHAREAAKVGLYVTLACRPEMPWPEKLRHFEHALHKHAHAHPFAPRPVWQFYHDLAVLVKTRCGEEALKLASHQDDLYAARLAGGSPRERLEREAKAFFHSVIGFGKECPDYLLPDDFKLLRMLRDQWV
jgi:hypothetical protein